jgi:AbrB family looped-hinge helix DNA binding protein
MKPARRLAVATLTSKGRITIPKEIRDYLRLRTGRRVEFQIDRHGQVMMSGLRGRRRQRAPLTLIGPHVKTL